MITSKKKHKADIQYFNIANSSKEFRSLLNKYKQQLNNKVAKPESIQSIFDIKKKKVERRVTEKEYIFNEVKEISRLNEEIRSVFGVKNITKPQSVIDSIEKRIKSQTKMQKEKFILKEADCNSRKIKIVNRKIALPLIFPLKNTKHSRIHKSNEDNNYANAQMQRHKSEGNIDFSKMNIKLNKETQEEYLAALDIMRNEFSTISLSFGDYFKRDRAEAKKAGEMIERLNKKVAISLKHYDNSKRAIMIYPPLCSLNYINSI